MIWFLLTKLRIFNFQLNKFEQIPVNRKKKLILPPNCHNNSDGKIID